MVDDTVTVEDLHHNECTKVQNPTNLACRHDQWQLMKLWSTCKVRNPRAAITTSICSTLMRLVDGGLECQVCILCCTEHGDLTVLDPLFQCSLSSQSVLVLYNYWQGRRQRGGRGGDRPPNKIGAMTTECVLLLHALDAFQNALYTTTRIYTRADYSHLFIANCVMRARTY